MGVDGSVYVSDRSGNPSISRLRYLSEIFSHSVWLNPVAEGMWHYTRTIGEIADIFPMFELSLDGLDKAITHLMAK